MLPTLRDGDLLLVRPGARVRIGRPVIVRLPDGTIAVKRVTFRVPEGWWVERDNPAHGVDSWQVGAVAPADVLGLVVARIWPLRRPG
jgi:SOS-response transcriptional repressor LexA